jgi:hypothetical protein
VGAVRVFFWTLHHPPPAIVFSLYLQAIKKARESKTVRYNQYLLISLFVLLNEEKQFVAGSKVGGQCPYQKKGKTIKGFPVRKTVCRGGRKTEGLPKTKERFFSKGAAQEERYREVFCPFRRPE